MLTNVDFNLLLSKKLTLEQYVIITFLAIKQHDLLLEYAKNIKKFNGSEVNELISRGYLVAKKTPFKGFEDLDVTNEGYYAVGLTAQKQWFTELWDSFPRTTPGGRVLKQISKTKAEKKYLSRVKSKQYHEAVLIALKNELEHRQSVNKIEFMQNLETWLNNESWNAYLEADGETKETSKKYGTDIE